MDSSLEEIFLTMVSFNQACICRTKEEFKNALLYRHYPFCEVAVLPNLAQADYYVRQRYHVNFFANPHLYGYPPMPLPSSANQNGYNIRGDDFSEIHIAANVPKNAQENLPTVLDALSNVSLQYSKPVLQPNVNDGLFWAIDSLNGFAVASNLDELIYFLLDAGLIYSHAIPYCDENSAAFISRATYLNRFACRYGFGEPIELPYSLLRCGEIFLDVHHAAREKRLQDNEIRNCLVLRGLL